MNEMTSWHPRALSRLPVLSQALKGWLWEDYDGARFGMDWVPGPTTQGSGISLPTHRGAATPTLIAEAVRFLPAYQAAARSPTAEYLMGWFKPLALVVRNPQGEEMLEALMPVFAAALEDVPMGVFTEATWRRAMQTFKFWPSPADVVELVRDEAQAIRRGISVLSYLASKGEK